MLLFSLFAAMVTSVLFENDRIRISDMRLPPNTSGGLAKHEYPTVRWQVNEGVHNREGIESQVPDKKVFWVNPGESFLVTNVGQNEYRQVTWEFKQPPKYSQAQVQALLDKAIFSTKVGTSLLFENSYCRVWDFYLEPGEGNFSDVHHHVLDYCFVYVAKGRLLGSSHDGTPGLFDSINEDGDVTWFDIPENAALDPSYAHGGKNGYDDIPMREYLVELK